jgi:hypothetical protein
MKDEEAIDWREGFPNFHWTRRTSSRRGHRRLTKREVVPCVFFLRKKEENECVKGKLVLMCEIMLFMEKMCANKTHGRKLCVASSCSGVHGRISHEQVSRFLFKINFLLKSIVGFVSNFQ